MGSLQELLDILEDELGDVKDTLKGRTTPIPQAETAAWDEVDSSLDEVETEAGGYASTTELSGYTGNPIVFQLPSVPFPHNALLSIWRAEVQTAFDDGNAGWQQYCANRLATIEQQVPNAKSEALA